MEDKLVTIAQFPDYIQADLARQLLEDFDIKAVVSGQNASNVLSGYGVGGPTLQVIESQAAEAVEILESNQEQPQDIYFENGSENNFEDDTEQEEE